ncbi:MAG: hypothetical protein AAB726_01115 [Patescibacteria group bacterium]
MLNDFKNVLITFVLVALVFVGGFFSYQKKIETEDMGDSYRSEIQAKNEDLESLRQVFVALQAQLADLEQQKTVQALEIDRLANQLAVARNQPKAPVLVAVPQVRVPASASASAPASVQPVVVVSKPTPKKVVVTKPSRRSRAS